MSIIYFILGAFARRWFGGLFTDLNVKILTNRGIQTIFMISLFMSIYVTNTESWQNWLIAAVVSCWLQFQFWSRGHGESFDIGRDANPSQDTIERYNERWYHYPCDWIFNKLGVSDYRYGFLYDFIYMSLRYACPMIPMMIFDWRYILIGLSVAPVYAFCWTLWEKEPWLRFKQSWLDLPTKWAEIIVGGTVFAGCYLLRWG